MDRSTARSARISCERETLRPRGVNVDHCCSRFGAGPSPSRPESELRSGVRPRARGSATRLGCESSRLDEPEAEYYEPEDFERLVEGAAEVDPLTHVIVPLMSDAGLR